MSKSEFVKKTVHLLNFFVFAAVTLAIMGFVYEAFALEWFTVVGVLILTASYSFMLSSVVNLIFYRKNKVILLFSIISFFLAVIALVMEYAIKDIEIPIILHVLWYFYVWFYYGVMVSKKLGVK